MESRPSPALASCEKCQSKQPLDVDAREEPKRLSCSVCKATYTMVVTPIEQEVWTVVEPDGSTTKFASEAEMRSSLSSGVAVNASPIQTKARVQARTPMPTLRSLARLEGRAEEMALGDDDIESVAPATRESFPPPAPPARSSGAYRAATMPARSVTPPGLPLSARPSAPPSAIRSPIPTLPYPTLTPRDLLASAKAAADAKWGTPPRPTPKQTEPEADGEPSLAEIVAAINADPVKSAEDGMLTEEAFFEKHVESVDDDDDDARIDLSELPPPAAAEPIPDDAVWPLGPPLSEDEMASLRPTRKRGIWIAAGAMLAITAGVGVYLEADQRRTMANAPSTPAVKAQEPRVEETRAVPDPEPVDHTPVAEAPPPPAASPAATPTPVWAAAARAALPFRKVVPAKPSTAPTETQAEAPSAAEENTATPAPAEGARAKEHEPKAPATIGESKPDQE